MVGRYVCVRVCVACAQEKHSPDTNPEWKLSGREASEESVTAGVELTDRYLYLPVIAHALIWLSASNKKVINQSNLHPLT